MIVISVRWVRSVTIIVGIWISLTVWDIIMLVKIVSIIWIRVVIPHAVKITVKLVITRLGVRAVVITGLVPVTCMVIAVIGVCRRPCFWSLISLPPLPIILLVFVSL